MLKERYKILLAEPDRSIAAALGDTFTKEGFDVFTASAGKEVLEKTFRYHPHIIILELSLPGVDGIEICHELRSNSSTRNILVTFYTSRTEDYAQIAAFGAGADDYILKPAKGSVLVMRVKALLKRLQQQAKDDIYKEGGLTIDRERYLVTLDGKDVTLPRKEFELLALLYSSPRKVFTRQEISRLIWGYEMQPRNRTIDVHVRKLREKLGERHIKTVKGIGYSLEP